MTPNEINRVISEHVGWTSLGFDAENIEWWIQMPPDVINRTSFDEITRQRRHYITNYTSSTDALRPVIKGLSPEQKRKFGMELNAHLVVLNSHGRLIGYADSICLDPIQLAEAVVRALGKWRDE